MALLLKHQTIDSFVSRFREAYRNSSQEQTVLLAKFIISHIQSTDFTDAQCRAVFGLNASQWNSLKGRMNALIAANNSIQSAIGE